MDKNKHKLYMAQILSLIFKDKDLCNVMAFKGGTSLKLFGPVFVLNYGKGERMSQRNIFGT